MGKKIPDTEKTDALLKVLKERFTSNKNRDQDLDWNEIETRILSQPTKIAVLAAMEETGGEPQVLTKDNETGEFLFFDTAAESPAQRRSLCYDAVALNSRKQNKPAGSAEEMAAKIGAEMLTEDQYLLLQKFGSFDLKTSSWLRTPPELRSLGGAIFGDRRYNRVFIYHNGAESYYAARGFRTLIEI